MTKQEIENLLKENKLEEALDLIDKSLKEIPEEKGAKGQVYTNLLLSYLDTSNDWNEKYEEELKSVVKVLEEIKAKERTMENDEAIERIKTEIENSN